MHRDDEEELLRSVAIQNAQSILAARQRAEQEMLKAKEALEYKTHELSRTLATMQATLESTWDGILAVDERGTVTASKAVIAGSNKGLLDLGPTVLGHTAQVALANGDGSTALTSN